ncbi:MAG: hypothetical protein JSV09_08865 [Thermoplasmata archaeon]|nr:MAG: hypothetical protein JSV09_08865 [Thermoplasmata archaeon]
MPYNCLRCGAKDSVSELDMNTLPLTDFANIDMDLMPDAVSHIYNIHYKINPWHCESCKSIYFRGSSEKSRKDIHKTCGLCKKGKLIEYENVAIGDVVIKDTMEKVGDFTIDEAIVCDICGFISIIETGAKTE